MPEEPKFPEDLKYRETHEWARREGGIVTVGISNYAQEELQDVVYVELPEAGAAVALEQEFGVIESVKAAFNLWPPVSGEVIEVNAELEDAPELINEHPYSLGWLIKIRMNNPDELDTLLSPDEYRTLVEGERD
ncbi:MAG: glycine cleavage system protein GcvH [Candidatus Poribacteria bacterium]|nr:glycine cleavage system protein GcvH [Candidatus Poribacteria bacterium]